MKFTKEIKNNWLKALKSGDYTQHQNGYREFETNKHCCLAVYDEVFIKTTGEHSTWSKITEAGNNYGDLIKANDKKVKDFKPDYSNVIPLIEKLETVD